MGRGKVLSEEERAQIRAARDQGLSLRAIATQLQRSRTVVGSYLNDPEGYNTRKATGRPCKLSAPEMERLLQEATTRGHVSARELRNDLDLPVSVRRVNGYLRQQKRHRSSLTPAPDDEDTVMTEAQGDVLMAQALPDAVATAWKSEHQPNQLPIPPATFGIASTSMASPEDVPLKTQGATFPDLTPSDDPMLRAVARPLRPSALASLSPRSTMAMSTSSLHAEVQNRDLLCTQGLIDGKWVDGHNAKHFAIVDPATEQEIARVADMGARETHEAIAAALAAQRKWRKTSPHARSLLLKKWFAAIRENTDDLATIMSVESGKPLAEAKGEVAYAAGFIDFYAHEALTAAGFAIPATTYGQEMIAVKDPVGVCGIITPWNFPLAMITRKLGPCLAAGCTAVVKPAAETPLSALALAKLAQEVGIPDGVINIVTAPNSRAAEVGEALALSNDVRKISFTGSTRVGKILMEQSASNVKRLSLELGGNAPFIIFEDADVDAAVDGLIGAKFRNTGQTCVCPNRVFVQNGVYEEFSKKFVARVEQLKMGNPRAPGVQLGPLVSHAAFQKTAGLVADAVAKGAKAVAGGKPSSHGSNFFEATVLTNLDESMQVWTEEIFGPVVPLIPFATEEEAIAKANHTEAGLAGYFYTRSLSRAWRVARELEVGMVGVNTGVVSNVQAPFGGVKQSGLGREGSHLGMEEYTETKLIAMNVLE